MDNFINPKDLLYPVGSVYISKYDDLNNCASYDPSLVFGGQWTEVLAADSSSSDYNFYNYNENTGLKKKVKYYVRVA